MSECKEKRLIIVQGDFTGYGEVDWLTIRPTSDVWDLSTMHATFELNGIVKEFNDLTEPLSINYEAEQTASMPIGDIDGVLRFFNAENKPVTVDNLIPVKVVKYVHGDAVKTSNFEMNIEVKQGDEVVMEVLVEAGVSVEAGNTYTLPAGDLANVVNRGTAKHLILDFYIPQGIQGEKGEDGEQGEPGIPGRDGADGKDATINGVNTLTFTASYGLTLKQNGSYLNIDGKEITDVVDGISALIPAQATEQNQLADKGFVNSSIATNTANFIGTFNSLAELEAYSGTVTNNDYAFVVGTDIYGNTQYDRYKYTTATTPASWLYEYTLNNSSFTAEQWSAINSGATDDKIGQITTNQNAIGTLSSLTTTTKTDLVTAVNEVNATAGSKISDVQINGTSITSGGVADIPIGGDTIHGVVKAFTGNSGGVAIHQGAGDNKGGLYIVAATTAEMDSRAPYTQYKPITARYLDYAVKTGVTDNGITLTDSEKTAANTWIGSLENVQLEGTDLTKDVNNKVNIPAAALNGVYGVVKLGAGTGGLAINSAGNLYVVGASQGQVAAKLANINLPVMPGQIDTAVKAGITTNTLTLTDSEKTAANTWIGSLENVQLEGTDLTKDANNKVNIPVAEMNGVGLLKLYTYDYGLSVVNNGVMVLGATNTQITDKTNTNRPLLPKNIDLAASVSARSIYDRVKAISSGTVELDDGIIFYTDSPSAATTYTINSTALTQTSFTHRYFNVLITMPSTAVGLDFTTNNNVVWAENETPDMSVGGRTYLLAFQTFDSGTHWVGSLCTWWENS